MRAKEFLIVEGRKKRKKSKSTVAGPGVYGWYGYYPYDSSSSDAGGGEGVAENFADGRNPGRKGLAKRVGVNCKQPVSKLRKIAKNSSGEKQRMAHWCANMKSGKNK